MAWIESHQELRAHPKTKKAARLLKINEAQLIGHLHFMWWWAIDHAPDGDITDYDHEEIMDAAGWTGKGDFVDALLNCGKNGSAGFLERTTEGRLLIHDWWEYAGKLIAKRQQNAERVRQYRERNAHVTRTQPARTPLNSTVQNTTEQYSTEQKTLAASEALKVWTSVRGELNVTSADQQEINQLVDLYGDEAVAQAIWYCNINKRSNYLGWKYIIAVLSGWQGEGTLGLHPHETSTNGTSKQDKPKYDYIEQPDGTYKKVPVNA